MNPASEKIFDCLNEVGAQRRQREADPALADRVNAVKRFQHARFSRSYADLLADPLYSRAAQFFLDDLYGPADFTRRDDQFARIVPALVKLFPGEIVGTVLALAQLHAMSERLDTAMARSMADSQLDARRYGQAWRRVGCENDRELQITLMLEVGAALDRYTRNALLRHSLRLMRGPARAAGLGALQEFLETGFETFRQMRGAGYFLETVAHRERELAAKLFAGADID